MSDMNVQQLLAQMRVLEAQAKAGVPAVNAAEAGTPKTDFSDVLKNSIDSVNETSQQASKLAEAFEKGDPGVSMAQLMIAMEKSSVSMQAMTQVRNRLLSAYQEIMSMPV
jgi:flagellar hook-basal body complex protein FliE